MKLLSKNQNSIRFSLVWIVEQIVGTATEPAIDTTALFVDWLVMVEVTALVAAGIQAHLPALVENFANCGRMQQFIIIGRTVLGVEYEFFVGLLACSGRIRDLVIMPYFVGVGVGFKPSDIHGIWFAVLEIHSSTVGVVASLDLGAVVFYHHFNSFEIIGPGLFWVLFISRFPKGQHIVLHEFQIAKV